ncbi:Uncharacterised protein [Mycobacteroides abscessus]|nr:Uncharacterised protein [Mycobacteroides abscessus]
MQALAPAGTDIVVGPASAPLGTPEPAAPSSGTTTCEPEGPR